MTFTGCRELHELVATGDLSRCRECVLDVAGTGGQITSTRKRNPMKVVPEVGVGDCCAFGVLNDGSAGGAQGENGSCHGDSMVVVTVVGGRAGAKTGVSLDFDSVAGGGEWASGAIEYVFHRGEAVGFFVA